MNYALMAGYSMTVLALIATPGPVVLLVTGCAARDGASSAVRTMIGSNLASLVLMAVAAAMLTGAVAIHPDILLLLAALGSIYITWLALSMLRPSPVTPGAATARGGVWSGFVTALSNPKDILFFAAFFPQFIQITSDVGLSLGLLSIIWGGYRSWGAVVLYPRHSALAGPGACPSLNDNCRLLFADPWGVWRGVSFLAAGRLLALSRYGRNSGLLA